MERRLAKINEVIKQEIGLIINELIVPEWGLTTITDVQIARNLKKARIWISSKPDTVNSLNRFANEIRQKLRPRLRLRYTPTLTFIEDGDAINRIDEILEKIK